MNNVKIFISHKKEDSSKALEISKYIETNYGYTTYVDELDHEIDPNNVVERIVSKLKKSTHLLVVFSEKTKDSMWVPFELGISYERNQGIGVLIWPNGTNLSYPLPEYLEEFPLMQCNKKFYNDNCYTNELDKYLEQIKILRPLFEADSIDIGTEDFKLKVNIDKSYAKEFINELKSKLKGDN
jgi:hypothetical protein